MLRQMSLSGALRAMAMIVSASLIHRAPWLSGPAKGRLRLRLSVDAPVACPRFRVLFQSCDAQSGECYSKVTFRHMPTEAFCAPSPQGPRIDLPRNDTVNVGVLSKITRK